MTKTYEINVTSGKYAIDQSDDHIYNIYHAYEYFLDNVFTPDDHAFINKIGYDFDIYALITIIE